MAERFCRCCGGWHDLSKSWPHNCISHFGELPQRSGLPAPRVARDTIEIQSMLDGKVYTSKAKLRETYRAAGVEEVGNEKLPPKATLETPGGIGDDLKAAFSQHA